MRRSAEPGFTLIELLVVILIIGILLAIAAPAFLGQQTKAQDSAAEQALTVGYKEVKSYWTTNQAFSTSASLASALQSGEPQNTWTAGTGCPAMPAVQVNVISSSQANLCTQSASGNNVGLMISPGASNERLGNIGPSSSSYTNLIMNPSFEGTGSGSVARLTNGGFAGMSASTSGYLYGQYGLKMTGNGADGSASEVVPVTAGTTYLAVTHIYATSSSRTNSRAIVWTSDAWPACNTNIRTDQFNQPTVVGAWTTYSMVTTAPAGAQCARVYAAYLNSDGAGEIDYADGLMFAAASSQIAYFDGSFPGASWTGAQGDSSSSNWAGTTW